MKQKIFRLALLITIILICGCTSPYPSKILDSDCAAPCWRDIKPGETPQDELLTQLSEMPYVKPASITIGHPWNIFSNIIKLETITGEKAEINLLDDIVAQITFSGKKLTTFEQSVEKFGEPDYIINLQSFGPGFLFGDAQHNFILALKPKKGIMYGYDSYYVPKSQRSEILPNIKIR